MGTSGMGRMPRPRPLCVAGRLSMKSRLTTIVLIVFVVLGVLVASYPFASSLVNQRYADEMISSYDDAVESMEEEERTAAFDAARSYNEVLRASGVVMTDPFDPTAQKVASQDYEDVLNVNGHGFMAHIDIPAINVHLPIFHGVSDEVLSQFVGHLQGTSLPVGGESTHCVLSAHTGIPTATLFTDLNKLEVGDLFKLQVLDNELWYRVSEIEVVLPSEVSSLKIESGRDLCTLVTCTPYGVNSHRLLVHGERTEPPTSNIETGSASFDWRLPLFAGAVLIALVATVRFAISLARRRTREERLHIRRLRLAQRALGPSSSERDGAPPFERNGDAR